MDMEVKKEALTLDLVRAKLNSRLASRGIDVDKMFITRSVINDQGTPVAEYSESLASGFYLQLQDNQIPVFGSQFKLYSVRYTVDESYLFSDVTIEELNQYGIEIAPTFLD